MECCWFNIVDVVFTQQFDKEDINLKYLKFSNTKLPVTVYFFSTGENSVLDVLVD